MTSKLTVAALAATCSVIAASSAYADSNIIGNFTSIAVGQNGQLPAGNGWIAGSLPSSLFEPITGSFLPEQTQWNAGSFWWDANDYGASSWTITLDKIYKIDSFLVQADDNDTYQVQYWNGSSWADAYDVPSVASYGLVTRPQFALATPIMTDALRVVATGGDGYYALGQIEAFGVAAPEPTTWAMMLVGFAGLGFAGYRAPRHRSAAA
jgi:hypothetical protein